MPEPWRFHAGVTPEGSHAGTAMQYGAWTTLFDAAHDVIVIVNGAHQIMHINQAVKRVLGFSKTELLGKSFFSLLANAHVVVNARPHRDGVFGPIVLRRKDGTGCDADVTAAMLPWHGMPALVFTLRDVSERSRMEQERERLIEELQEALARVKRLSGLLPICANCKRIRDYAGYWEQVDAYIAAHSDAAFSHSICPDCRDTLYPEVGSGRRA